MHYKTKIILFDVDGVLIRPPHYFSHELNNQGFYNADISLDHYYQSLTHQLCLTGKAEHTKSLIPYLEQIGWNLSSEEYLKQQFYFEQQYLDKQLISIIEKLQQNSVICCLCTDQESKRADFLLNKMNFNNIFHQHFISYKIGYRKCQDNFWIYVLNQLKEIDPFITPPDILYFDDVYNNIATARQFGIQAFLFTDLEQLKKDLKIKL